ncbi:MAG: endonuclease/exonuclease/phosphatase family protein [Planctomycetota bacterium]
MKRPLHRLLPSASLALSLLAAPAAAQWNPAAGEWGKDDPNAIRVMTWNVEDGICSSNFKNSSTNNWAALARVVAAMQPDVLLLQEAGDNDGNGTGSGGDSVSSLLATVDLFLHGGFDFFKGVVVTEYVQKYAPGYDLPFVYVSSDGDGFNRNVTLSRFPYSDLNGDGKATIPNIPTILADEYVPSGGVVTPRGTPWVEIDLPDATYGLDLVVGNSHLKAGGGSDDKELRILTGQRLAYYIDYLLNGGGTGTPDPHGKVIDSPPATTVVSSTAAVIHAGDFNDKAYPGEDGVEWCSEAEFQDGFGPADGPDADRTDLAVDFATEPFSGSAVTQGSSKLDYFTWEDSLLEVDNSFVFYSLSTPFGSLPPELGGFFSPLTVSSIASDHRPVLMDFQLIELDCDGDGIPDTQEPDTDGDGVIDDCDNCPLANPDQLDVDGNGIGDACETFACQPTFGAGTMQFSICGDAFTQDGTVFFEPKSAPAWVVVSSMPLPVPVPLLPGADSLLVPGDVLVPFTTTPSGFGSPLPSQIVSGPGPQFLLWYVQVVAFDPLSGNVQGSNGVELTYFL